jgi:hypothetical protein
MSGQPSSVAAMGEAARRLFEAEFDLPIAVSKWVCLLREVAQASARQFDGYPLES